MHHFRTRTGVRRRRSGSGSSRKAGGGAVGRVPRGIPQYEVLGRAGTIHVAQGPLCATRDRSIADHKANAPTPGGTDDGLGVFWRSTPEGVTDLLGRLPQVRCGGRIWPGMRWGCRGGSSLKHVAVAGMAHGRPEIDLGRRGRRSDRKLPLGARVRTNIGATGASFCA